MRTIQRSYTEIPPGKALNPVDLTLLSHAQYSALDSWNTSFETAFRHPSPFDPKKPVHWVQGQSLDSGAPVMIPAANVFLGYPNCLETGFTVPDSNGLAAGTDRQDALLRALFEVVERDAVSIWWYNKLRRPGIDTDATSLSCSVSAWLQLQGRSLALLDLTHDFRVPVVAAVSFDDVGADISIGFAASASIENAVDSALGEMVQFDLTKRMAKFEKAGGHSAPFLLGIAKLYQKNAPFLFPSKEKRPQQQSEVTYNYLIEAFKELAPETAVFEFLGANVCVVRVVAPGMRPIWPRFAPGRLYSVPVTLGWRRTAQKEEALNKIPILY